MDEQTRDSLVMWGSAIAGGAGGAWAVTRLGATMGRQFGPWGMVAGALVGAVAAAALSKMLLGNTSALLEAEAEEV
jgi:hypothetical protein